ncbi:hypothetical protein E2C01_075266 [Portunus trituberculatus]|uniref:Ig-like domain-containing protein n=1 Tax=Portunus trituberculatus TaxID=210409 RepID=A0A5B7I835_PORTR|nr:hypothetical protein [Portunus trituberculatus]
MFVRKPRAVEVQEGDLVVIECEVAGEPKPHVTWVRDWLKRQNDKISTLLTGETLLKTALIIPVALENGSGEKEQNVSEYWR